MSKTQIRNVRVGNKSVEVTFFKYSYTYEARAKNYVPIFLSERFQKKNGKTVKNGYTANCAGWSESASTIEDAFAKAVKVFWESGRFCKTTTPKEMLVKIVMKEFGELPLGFKKLLNKENLPRFTYEQAVFLVKGHKGPVKNLLKINPSLQPVDEFLGRFIFGPSPV